MSIFNQWALIWPQSATTSPQLPDFHPLTYFFFYTSNWCRWASQRRLPEGGPRTAYESMLLSLLDGYPSVGGLSGS